MFFPALLIDKVLFGGQGETSMHPVILVAMVVAIVLILKLPRKWVIVPVLALSIPIPYGQVLMIGPFHFQPFRILMVFAWIRLLSLRFGSKGGQERIKFNAVDKAVIGYAVSCIVCYTLLWQDSAALIDQLGRAYNVLGMYFFCRYFLRDQEDAERTIKTLAIVALFIAGCMLNEQMTGVNVLAVFGGVPMYTAVREGYLRSQGPFTVYLTAGSFGSTLFALFVGLWYKGGSRLFAVLGVIASITITITSRTSTALSAIMFAFIGMGMWLLRDKMRAIRWGALGATVMLHLTMKAPVWALLAKVDLVGGSTGWHRFKIIDNFVNHFWDWWLLGTNNWWSWEGGDDMFDLANQYVFTGETTGLLSLIFFMATIVYCFKYLGIARKSAPPNSHRAWFLWLLGVALFSNLVAFLGISYYDQISQYWYALLATIVAAALPVTSCATQNSLQPAAVAPRLETVGGPVGRMRGSRIAAARQASFDLYRRDNHSEVQ